MTSIYLNHNYLYNINFSPFFKNSLACCTAACYGIKGSGCVYVLTTQNKKLVQSATFSWIDSLTDLCWSKRNEDLLVTGSCDGSLQIWNCHQTEGIPQTLLRGHKSDVSCVDWGLNTVASSSWDCSILIWDINRSCCMSSWHAHEDILHAVQWSPLHSNLLVSVASDGKIKVWDSLSQSCISQGVLPGIQVLDCDWSKHDVNIVSSCGTDGLIHGWDMRNMTSPCWTLRGHYKPVRRIEMSPHHCNVIASASYDCDIRLWDVARECCMERITHHSSFAYGVHFNPFNSWEIADCGWDSLVHVFEPASLVGCQPVPYHIINKL